MAEGGLAAWLRHLEALHPSEIELGLERVRAVADALRLLPVAVPVVSIAGTNGKGSTAAALEALLLQAGRRPGLYTSPHLLRYNERIRVAGVEAGDDLIIRAFEQIESARGDTSLTYFEFGTLAALWIFRELGADVLVLEVGLGGRLDAVNIVDPSVAVITRIALDHQSWLGDNLDAIAREKAGILRAGRPAVIAHADPPRGLLEAAAERGAQTLVLGRDFEVSPAGEHWRATLHREDGQPLELPPLPLGAVLPSNLAAALQALLLLGEDPGRLDLARSLGTLQPAGRRQQLEVAGRRYVLDVAHNPDSVEKLLEFLELSNCKGKTIALFSVMEDKDIRAMIRPCIGTFAAWFLGDQPDNPRAASAAETAALLRSNGATRVSESGSLQQALQRAQRSLVPGDRLVVFGSFFTVGAVMAALEGTCDGGTS